MILQQIQAALKAPKNQRNNFGGYNYRSCEDILEALKPVLAAHNAAVILSDEVVLIGTRYYIKATATLKTEQETLSTTAYAREADTRKGMDESQITGSASSYARKYALNGLFGIDDTRDADTQDPKHALLEDKKFIALAQTVEELADAMQAIKAKRGAAFERMRTQYTLAYNERKAQLAGGKGK